MRVAACALLLVLSSQAGAADAFVTDLEQGVRTHGVESVNAQLSAAPSQMARLNQRTADCDPPAIDLSVKLSRTRNSKAGELHKEALRIAVGACTESVLSLLSPAEVPKICASVSTWTVGETARELRRRIRQLERDERVRPVQHGKACGAAYLFELQNTRVGIRAGPPGRQVK